MISARQLALVSLFVLGGIALTGCPDSNKPGAAPAASGSAASTTATTAPAASASAKPTTGGGW